MFKASNVLPSMQEGYERKIRNDSKLRKIRKKLQNGADQSTAQQYAVRSGELLSETFKENITADLFDEDEPLERDELADAMIPMMNRNYEHVVAAASAAQKYMNQEGGLGLKPIEPEFDSGAAMNIVGRMSNYDSFEDAEWMLDEPIVTNSQHIADESLRENAEFQRDSGLKPKIVRTCESDACEWCQMLAGEYDIDEITGKDDPVYQRHNNCACEITFVPGYGRDENITGQMINIGDIDERISKTKAESEKWRKEQEKIRSTRIMKSENIELKTDFTGSKLPSLTERGIELPEQVKYILEETKTSGYCKTSSLSNNELRILTQETGVEFAKMTIGDEVYVLKGHEKGVTLTYDLIDLLKQKGGEFNAHCHPFIGDIIPSEADKKMIEIIESITGQQTSEIISVDGKRAIFTKYGIMSIEVVTDDNGLSEKDKMELLRLFGGD